MMKFDIVIPTYNEAEYIEDLLRSLYKEKEYINKIIIVDGMSEDDTKRKAFRYLYHNYSNYNISYEMIDNPKRTTASARDLAMKYVETEYFIQLCAHGYSDGNLLRACAKNINKYDPKEMGITIPIVPVGKTWQQKFNAWILKSKLYIMFGYGTYNYINHEKGEKVVFNIGALRKDIFERFHVSDVDCGDDSIMNKRAKEHGFYARLCKDSKYYVYTRKSIFGFIKQQLEFVMVKFR